MLAGEESDVASPVSSGGSWCRNFDLLPWLRLRNHWSSPEREIDMSNWLFRLVTISFRDTYSLRQARMAE